MIHTEPAMGPAGPMSPNMERRKAPIINFNSYYLNKTSRYTYVFYERESKTVKSFPINAMQNGMIWLTHLKRYEEIKKGLKSASEPGTWFGWPINDIELPCYRSHKWSLIKPVKLPHPKMSDEDVRRDSWGIQWLCLLPADTAHE